MNFIHSSFAQRAIYILVLFTIVLAGCKEEELGCPKCPEINKLVPDNGRAGDVIRLEGVNFTNFIESQDKVTINGKSAILSSAPTQNFLEVIVPDNAGTGPVRVKIGNLISNEGKINEAPVFTYNYVIVNEVTPNRGKPGDVVYIKGKYFDLDASNNEVIFSGGTTFDPILGTITNVRDSLLEVVVPEDGITGPISVRVDGHTAGGPSFSYFGDVSVTSINPDHGKAGDAITIHGTNFRTNLNDNRVLFFDEIEVLDILSGTDTTLTVKVPEGAETGPVSVEVAGKRADGPVFTYDLVEISALIPDHGRAGESIRIEGANFNLVPGLNEVLFNGIAGNVTSADVDHIIVTVPVGVIDGPVSVTVGGYTTQGPNFTVDLPEITSLSSQQGKKDDLITIHGNYFGTNPNAIIVKFNGKQATLASAPTETQLDVFVPARAGTGPVTVDVNGALATGPVFTYAYTTVVYTFAGDGTAGSDNGQGTAARFKVPTGIEFGSDGHFYIADRANHRIRKITQGGDVSTFAGDVQGYEDGQGTAAKFKAPGDIVMDANGDIIVADELNNRLRKIDAQGNVTSFSGNGQTYQYNNPSGIAIAPNGNIFVADTYNNRILKVSPNGTFTIFAGGGTVPGYADGVGADAKFSSPTDVAVDSVGNVYVADRNNGMIRKITPNAVVTTVAGSLTSGYEDGQGSAAKFKSPTSITIGPDGNIYVADLLNHRIRMVTPSGLVSTIAGSGFYGFINGSGEQAEFKNPEDLVFDDEGNLYIADSNNHSIRKISFE